MRPAFTLMELLITVTIIALLAALLLPVISMVREVAKRTRCAAHERQLWSGMMAWTTDHNGILLPWERAADESPTWWPAILLEYTDTTVSMMDGSDQSRYRKDGYNILTGCPDFNPGEGKIWNGFYTVWERDGKSLGYAYTERPTRDWAAGDGGFTNGWGGRVRLARVTHPDQRIAFFESDDSRADPTPSRTVREGDWSDPYAAGGVIWKKDPRHRGRPNAVLFSGRMVSVRTQEQGYWTWLEGSPYYRKGWLRYDTRDWRWGTSEFFNGLENPGLTTY